MTSDILAKRDVIVRRRHAPVRLDRTAFSTSRLSEFCSEHEGTICVTDNGPGIPPDVVGRVVDYTNRTSSRAGYVSPTRGQQGNAMQCIIAMHALQGAETVIEAHGVHHRIRLRVDAIRQEPRVEQ